MRKGILLMMVLLMLVMAGCFPQPPVETAEKTEAPATMVPTTEATTVPTTEPVPETEGAEILADQVPAILMFKNRGDQLDVVGKYDEEHYVVKTDSGYGLVEKFLIRMEGEKPFECWTGYSLWNAAVYSNYYLTGDPVKMLDQNVEVEVLEDLGICYLIKTEDLIGYVAQKQISKWPVTYSGGGGGDSSDSGGSGGGQDGGDITMGAVLQAIPLSIIEQRGEITGKAEIKADNTPVILGYFDQGETVPAVTADAGAEEMEGYRLLYWDGIYAYVETPLIRVDGEATYEEWDGFAVSGAKAFFNYHLTGDPLPNIWVNLPVHVVHDLGDVYMVMINDTVAYMEKTAVSETRIPVYQGGGDSSDSGGSGGNEWSDPVL